MVLVQLVLCVLPQTVWTLGTSDKFGEQININRPLPRMMNPNFKGGGDVVLIHRAGHLPRPSLVLYVTCICIHDNFAQYSLVNKHLSYCSQCLVRHLVRQYKVTI